MSRAHLMKCHYCGSKGATVGCKHRQCKRSYHLRCAVLTNCTLLEAVPTIRAGALQAKQNEKTLKTSTELHTLMLCPEHSLSVQPGAPPPAFGRIWTPSEPVRRVIPLGFLCGMGAIDDEKWISRQLSYGKGRIEGNGQALRVGALTVLNIGTPRIDLSAFHTSSHIFPHLYCAARIFWSMTRPGTRTLYVK